MCQPVLPVFRARSAEQNQKLCLLPSEDIGFVVHVFNFHRGRIAFSAELRGNFA